MPQDKFLWFWQDPDEFRLYKKFQEMPEEEFTRVEQSVKDRLVYKYGNQYFYKPSFGQQPILESNATDRFVHGNNSSGKSYTAAKATSEQVTGFSPSIEVPRPKYGDRIVWVFSPTYNTQRTSSQVHLFSLGEDVKNDIGLLPSLKYISDMGGTIGWEDKDTLKFVKFPDGTLLEFKTEEMQVKHLAASGIDFAWFDEKPKTEDMMDEVIARLIRKDGKMIMSFIEDDRNSYLIRLYNEWIKGNLPEAEFFFLDVQDNPTLSDKEIEKHLSRFKGSGKEWRFSEGGKFYIAPEGNLVYEDMSDLHLFDELAENYDPARTIVRSWDRGYRHPACVMVQQDQFGIRNYMSAVMGTEVLLTDFIDEVKAHCNELYPRAHKFYDLLPHDMNRRGDDSKDTGVQIFKKKGLCTL
jgi:phage terminase large subunit-like protein